MKQLHIFFYLVAIFLLSCQAPTKQALKSRIVFQLDSTNYIYDIAILNHQLFLLDNKNDSVLRIYSENNPLPIQSIQRGQSEEKLFNPGFTKEVTKNKQVISILDNNLYLKRIDPEKLSIYSCQIIKQLENSLDYNITSKEIYASPIIHHGNYAYYYYNELEDYYWVEPSKLLQNYLPAEPAAYSNNLCVNEEENCVAVAYRFTNTISFHDLDESVKRDFTTKERIFPILSNNRINIESSTKCFTAIYGTEKYLYCLYDGSSDFTASSTLYQFKWSGKLSGIFQLDRNIRTFAIDPDNLSVMAVSRNKQGGQDLLQYTLIK